MNIVVTIPKNKIAEVEAEEKEVKKKESWKWIIIVK